MNQLGYKPREPISSIVCAAKFNREVLTSDVAHFLQAATEGSRHGLEPFSRRRIDKPDRRHC
jgi:hypothetical protein